MAREVCRMRQSVAAGLLVLRNRILSADNLHEDGGDYGCAGVFVCVFVHFTCKSVILRVVDFSCQN